MKNGKLIIVLGRGPKFALAAAINESTKEICQTSFARFAYQYRWSITRENNQAANEDHPGGSEDLNVPPFPRSWDINLPPPMDSATESKLRRIYHSLSGIVGGLPERRRWSNLPRQEAAALRGLRSKPIALMPSDKGGEFCAINLDTYKNLARTHLADATTYRPVPRMTARTIEAKINRSWRTVCRARHIPWRCERSYIASSTCLATFHHVLKTHKPDAQLKIRPIVASRGSPTEKIAWLLNKILGPLLQQVPTHMPNSEHLMTALTEASPQVLCQHNHQCSLDVVSLYTSIPVDDALDAVRDKLQAGGATPQPLLIDDVIQLLLTVFSQSYFCYDSKVYRQVRGLPMGCATSGMVAILFMERIERRALAQFARCPLFLRYVDDCYALVKDASEARELQAQLNSQHPAIQFELEHCSHDQGATSLSLLDLTVNIEANGEPSFNFYVKKAKTNVFMHRDSALPWSQKAATIRSEQRRIASRSSGESRANQASFLDKLRANGYTRTDLQRVQPTSRRRRPSRTPPEGKAHYIDLPFLGDTAERKIRRAFTREGINIRIYRRSTTILDMVRPRQADIRRCTWADCPTRDAGTCFTKNCVYEVTCLPCRRTYVGSTTRPLHERIREHAAHGRGSTIHDHLVSCGDGTAQVHVRILAREKDEVNTRLREAILIKKQRPDLNTQEDSEAVNIVF
jgi:hypothetical protein